MHGVGGPEGRGSLTALGLIEVSVKLIAEVRMGAFIDNEVRTFVGCFCAKIGHSLFGYHDLDGVFAVVGVTDQGNDRTDFSAFGQ